MGPDCHAQLVRALLKSLRVMLFFFKKKMTHLTWFSFMSSTLAGLAHHQTLRNCEYGFGVAVSVLLRRLVTSNANDNTLIIFEMLSDDTFVLQSVIGCTGDGRLQFKFGLQYVGQWLDVLYCGRRYSDAAGD